VVVALARLASGGAPRAAWQLKIEEEMK